MNKINYKKVKLIGGTRDGEEVEVLFYPGWSQPFIFLTRKISIEDLNELQINDSLAWKCPEDIYVRKENGDYVFDQIQHYKPS